MKYGSARMRIYDNNFGKNSSISLLKKECINSIVSFLDFTTKQQTHVIYKFWENSFYWWMKTNNTF